VNFGARFEEKRRALMERTILACGDAWTNRTWGERETFIGPAVGLAEGGMRAMADLVDASFTHRARLASNDPELETPSTDGDFDLAEILGEDPRDIYDKPFGVLGWHLSRGDDFKEADNKARSFVESMIATHLTLAQTHAAVAWIEAYNA
jgi:hypothetical protein